jgi:hypothetical protein
MKTETKINWQSGFEEEKKKSCFWKKQISTFFLTLVTQSQ